ncbi:MAG: hypothetical protein JXD23_11840 [Spirochaetales bacterium]|nr:hypothetical protein [Spirochaetales bacterium]
MTGNRNRGLLAAPFYLFDALRLPAEKSIPEDVAEDDAKGIPSRVLLCTVCGTVVTSPDERTRLDNSFEYVFTNPGGFVYRIGCFRKAPGCLQSGEPTDFFTWFPGYAWSFALCRGCVTHLGWHFTGPEDDFFGLILNQLKAA